MINKQKINEIEISAFLKFYDDNANEIINFYNLETCEIKTSLTQKELYNFKYNFLKAFLGNKTNYKITGADVMQKFNIEIADEDVLRKVCQDIWDHPEKYYTISDPENYYYEFLKYLCVEGLGWECRLTDLIERNPYDYKLAV